MGLKEDLFGSLGINSSGNGSDPSGNPASQEEVILGESDYGVEESGPGDFSTRVKAPAAPEKPVRSRTRSKTQPRSGARFEVYISGIKENIEEQLNDAGIVAGEKFGFTTAGYVTVSGSEAFADAVVEMARSRPRLLKVLEKAGKGASVSKILKYALAIYLAVLVDMETRTPYSYPMQYLGITEAYEKTHPDGPATQSYQQPAFTPPPTFD